MPSPTRIDRQGSIGRDEAFFLSATLSISNIVLDWTRHGGIGGIGHVPAAISISCFNVVMLVLGQAIGDILIGFHVCAGRPAIYMSRPDAVAAIIKDAARA
jgi:hypothetical protein